MSQALTGAAIQFHEPAMTWDAPTVCLYGVPLAAAITALVIGILALMQAHGVLDCGSWIGSISTRGAITNVSISALGIIFLFSLKPIIVAIVKCSTKFADVSDYPKNAPAYTYTSYGDTYCVTHDDGRQTTHRFVGSANRFAFEEELRVAGMTKTPLLALKTGATFEAHGKDAAESFSLGLIANLYINYDSWREAFEEMGFGLQMGDGVYAYYNASNFDFELQKQLQRTDLPYHFILQINPQGERSIHMFAALDSAKGYVNMSLRTYQTFRHIP